MPVLTVASYTPADKTPRAFALSGTATSLQIVNGAGMRLQILLGASLVGLVNANASVIFSVSNPTAVVVAPDLVYATRREASATGLVTITTYAAGDPLPVTGTYEQGTLAPISGQIHFSLERLRSGMPWNVRDFGAQGNGVADDGPAVRAALDVARILGGGRVHGPAGRYLIDSAVTNAEIATLAAGMLIGDNVTLTGDGPGLTDFQAGPNLLRLAVNAILYGIYPAPVQEFYISTSGNDGNPGTRALPFRTIKFAVTQVTQPGTVFHVAPGTYSEAEIDTDSTGITGTSSNPIIVISDVPWGAKIVSTANGLSSRIVQLHTYWWWIGFDMTGQNADAAGIAIGGTGALAAGNYLHQCCRLTDGSGISVTNYNAVNVIIANNVVLEAAKVGTTQGHGIYANGTGPIVINNLVMHCDGAGIHTYHQPTAVVIVGNTVFGCDAGAGTLGGILLGVGGGFTCQGCLVANNISVNNTGYGYREFADTGGVMGTNTITNNLFFNNTVANTLLLAGNVSNNQVSTDPRFINYQLDGSGDYRLMSGSPALGAGTSSGLPGYWSTFDLHGDARPGGALNDIGCFQRNSWGARRTVLLANYNPSTGNKDITISDATFDGAAASGGGQIGGVYLARALRSKIDNVTVRNVAGGYSPLNSGLGQNESAAILLDLCDLALSRVSLYSDDGGTSGTGLYSRYALNVTLNGCSAYGLGGTGFNADTCSHVRYVGCTSYLNGGHGFAAFASADVRYEKCEAGMLAPPVAGNNWTAGQALGNTLNGFNILASTVLFVSCLTLRNTLDGVFCDGSSTVTGSDVIARNNGANGFEVGGVQVGGRFYLDNVACLTNGAYGLKIPAAFDGECNFPRYFASANVTAAYTAHGVNFANARGAQTAPVVPATGVAQTNYFPFDMIVHVAGGTVSAIALDGTNTGLTAGTFRVHAFSGSITITYTGVPAWTWFHQH